MSLRPGRSCLQDELSEYAAGRLPAGATRQWDLHLVACERCRRIVDVERRLQSVMSTAQPVLPDGLRSALLALAMPTGPVDSGLSAPRRGPARFAGGPAVPSVPPAPFAVTQHTLRTLPVVRPTAPALHRSALRSAMMATVVASASAAAAMGLAVTAGSSGLATSGVARPAVQPSTSTPGPLGGSGPVSSFVPAAFRWNLRQPALLTSSQVGAQSTP